jgi:hypothetical protein
LALAITCDQGVEAAFIAPQGGAWRMVTTRPPAADVEPVRRGCVSGTILVDMFFIYDLRYVMNL